MLQMNRINLRALALNALVTLSLGAAILAPQPALAQARALPDFTDLVDQVGPSVVNIRTLEKAKPASASGGGNEEQMLEFFRRFGIPVPPNMPRSPRPDRGQPDEDQPRGVGSGFVLSSDGFVMTNAHVVDGADEVIVTLPDKREFKAKVVGADKRTDVAVLKIDAKQLPAVAVGEVSRVKVGEWVMAIGTPFGLENTVTAGIVSAKARDTGEEIRFIQTDVAVNPGNSGGPLINMRGEVVGINSQILSRSGGFMGISLSIPIDDAMKVADQLRSGGKVIRGRIGVSIAPVSKDVAESIGLGKAQGALVQAVEPGTPADKAGVEAGDIITKFNGQTIDKAPDLPRLVAATKPGTKSTLQVFRRGVYKELTVTVAEMDTPKAKAESGKEDAAQPMASATALGLSVSDLSDVQKRELRQNGGVLVKDAQGPAARAGLRAGDIILSVANVQIASAKEFEAVLSKLERGRAVNVLVRRGEWAQYAVIRPGK